MIFKVIAVIAVLFLIYILLFKKNRETDVTQTKKEKDVVEDEMVECPTCNTFVSKKEGILSNGKYFCSKECLLNQ